MKKFTKLIFIILLISKGTLIQSQSIGSTNTEKKETTLDSIKANAVINVIEEGALAKKELENCIADKKTQATYIGTLEEQASLFFAAQLQSESIIEDKDKLINDKKAIINKKENKITFWKWLCGALTTLLIYIAVVK